MADIDLAAHFKAEPLSQRIEKAIALFDQDKSGFKSEFESQAQNLTSTEWIKAKLAYMFKIDQHSRDRAAPCYQYFSTSDEQTAFRQALGTKFSCDEENTSDLKNILKTYDWIRVSVFGTPTDMHAWTIVQHADHDHQFQKDVLRKLEALYLIGETDPAHYAYLYDRVMIDNYDNVGPKNLQRYGTQGNYVGNQWEPYPVEAPEHLNKRRKSVGLEPIEEYRKAFRPLQI